MELEKIIMTLVRSFREANFGLYIAVLDELLPWFFALDSKHYARWLPIHVKDMLQLEHKHPRVKEEFDKGKFTVQITAKLFSTIALDQAHEQLNELVKGDGGAIGLTENPAALLRWMIAGPEIARMVHEFEEDITLKDERNHSHHEQTLAHQRRFTSDVKSMVQTIEELGNPFEDESDEIVALVTKEVASTAVNKSVQSLKISVRSSMKPFGMRGLLSIPSHSMKR